MHFNKLSITFVYSIIKEQLKIIIMKTSQFFWDEKNNRVEIWYEVVDERTLYWKKINGASFILTKRQYSNIVKKYGLKEL